MISSALIKTLALDLGFDTVGIARLESLIDDAQYHKKWLEKGKHAQMLYLENHLEKRENPSLLVDGCQSVIVVGMSYHPKEWLFDEKSYRVSAYAFGDDYHIVVKGKLEILLKQLQQIDTNITGRFFTDSAPVFERRWAQKAGLGWIGKNGCLINKKLGSFFFIGELFVNVDLEADIPFEKNYCGSCKACLDACPTNALNDNSELDACKCVSYQTIENKLDILPEIKGQMQSNIFGCDICQRVCPWNQKRDVVKEKFFSPSAFIQHLFSQDDSDEISQEDFQRLRKGTPFERIKYEKWLNNRKALKF